MDASRRVVFKFRLTDEQMINQLKNILESGSTAKPTDAPSAEPTDAPSAEPTVEPDATLAP